MNSVKVIFIIFTALGFCSDMAAQCCAAGNPVDGNFDSNSGANKITISTTYKHSFSDDYYNGNNISEYNYIEYSYFDFQSLDISYGITNELNIKATIGHYYVKGQALNFPIPHKRLVPGLGDGGITVSYNLSTYLKKFINITPSVGMRLPIGEFDRVVNNVVAPIDIQPSSGCFKLNGGLFLAKSFFNKRLTLSSYNFIEISDTIKSERVKSYKYGHLYLNTFGLSYSINSFLPSVQLRSEFREKSIDKSKIMDATGGHVVYLGSKLTYNLDKFNINLGFDYPIYKNVNRTQLTNKYIISAGLSYSLDMGKSFKSKKVIEIPGAKGLKELSFNVQGKCGMCKERIESIALSFSSIKFAEWNINSETLAIKYSDNLNINKLTAELLNAGHDNEFGKASDKAYSNLHECCKYIRK